MVRFAIDPMLKKGAGSKFVDVGAFDEFSTTPKSVELKVKMVDGWYKPEEKQTLTAWVMKEDNGEILALSPICKHLGCTVTWEGSPDFKDEFFASVTMVAIEGWDQYPWYTSQCAIGRVRDKS